MCTPYSMHCSLGRIMQHILERMAYTVRVHILAWAPTAGDFFVRKEHLTCKN